MTNRKEIKQSQEPRKTSETAKPTAPKKDKEQKPVLRRSHLNEMVRIRNPKDND
jgi:hypothetical protein